MHHDEPLDLIIHRNDIVVTSRRCRHRAAAQSCAAAQAAGVSRRALCVVRQVHVAARAAAVLQRSRSSLMRLMGWIHCCKMAAKRAAAFLEVAVPAVGVAQSEAVSMARMAPADKNARPHAAKAVRTQRIRNRWTASMPGIVATADKSY